MNGLEKITSPSGASFWVAKPHAERFRGLIGDLESSGYGIKPKESGGYNYRTIAGTNKLSQHAHGNAIDINWMDNARGTAGNIPPDLARSLAQKHGMKWGGDWKNPDPMHFEVAVPGQPGHTYGDGHNHGAPPAAVRTPADPEMPGLMPGAPRTASPMPAAPTGAAPAMTPYNGPSPDDVSQSRRMAQMLMQQGMSTEPVGHWTQALARVLQGGVGGMYQNQAKTGEQQGTASIAAMLQGGGTPDVSTLIQNPWTRDIGSGALKAGLVKKLAGTEYGKQGTIVQDADGNFYTAQFASDGTRRIEPLTVGGKSPSSVTIPNEMGQATTVNRLQPSKGTRNVGGAVQDVATGKVLGNVEEALASGKKAEAVGTAQGAHVAKFPQLEAAMSGWERQIDNTDKTIERAKTVVKSRGQMVAGYGGLLANLPATDARRLRNDLETIKANIGFDKLQAMREASPTGGALGAISDMENKLLQAVQGALDQMDDPAALSASLENIQGMMRQLKVEKRRAFEADKQRFGGAAQPQGAPPGAGIPAPATGGWSLKRLD